jgi:cyanophycinase
MTLVLIGGGTEEAGGWSDPLFAEYAGTTVAVLGTSESDEPGWYRDYLLSLGALDAEEIVIATREEAIAADLSRFDAFFLRGGDQWDYVSAWADTPVEDAIAGGLVVGGTSAGAMVLGGLDYTAEDGGVDPEDVLAAYGGTLATGFLDELLPYVLVDTHFTQRGRIGRLLPWVGCEDVVGIGVDDMTGIVLGSSSTSAELRVVGTGTVSVVSRLAGACEAGAPPSAEVHLDVLTEPYNLDENSQEYGFRDYHSVEWATADVHVADGTEGSWAILHPREDDLYCGTLELQPGQGRFAGIAVPDAWEADTVEARVGGAIYALPTLSLPVGLLMPAGTTVDVLPEGGFAAAGDASAVVMLAEWGATTDPVGWQDPDCEGARLARGLTDVRAAVVPPDGTVAFPGAGYVEPTDTGDSGAPAAEPGDTGGCGCGGGSAAWVLPVWAMAWGRRRPVSRDLPERWRLTGSHDR